MEVNLIKFPGLSFRFIQSPMLCKFAFEIL